MQLLVYTTDRLAAPLNVIATCEKNNVHCIVAGSTGAVVGGAYSTLLPPTEETACRYLTVPTKDPPRSTLSGNATSSSEVRNEQHGKLRRIRSRLLQSLGLRFISMLTRACPVPVRTADVPDAPASGKFPFTLYHAGPWSHEF